MSNYNDPAFPCGGADQGFSPCSGMSRLDYFAAAVLAGDLAHNDTSFVDLPVYADYVVKLAKAVIDAIDNEGGDA